jgi:hypothetical protein
VRTRAALRQNNNNNKIKRVIDERQVRTRAALAKKQGIKKHMSVYMRGEGVFFKRPTIERLVDAVLYIINFIINGYYRVVPMLGLYYHIYGM